MADGTVRWARVRDDFPALRQRGEARPVAYLDSAATAQKPQVVLDAVHDYEAGGVGNVQRGVYAWASRSHDAYEGARSRVARFLGAARDDEVVFTKGTTDALNLVAASWGADALRSRPKVVVSELEHHANLVPWQQLCARSGAACVVLPMNDSGDLDVARLENLVDEHTAVVAVCHVSNALGTRVPVERIAARARAVGALCVVDGAQAVPHLRVDVQALGCDAYAFSGHKAYGPSGVGALWMRHALLAQGRPVAFGGGMVTSVAWNETSFAAPPARYEAGTPHVAGAVGLAAALEYLETIGHVELAVRETELLNALLGRLQGWPGVRVIGAPDHRVGVVSLVVEGVHPHDVGSMLDAEGIAVRTGLHCAEPAIRRMGVSATVRVSVGLYTSHDDLERFIRALAGIQEMFV